MNEGNERELQREQLDTVEFFFFLKKKKQTLEEEVCLRVKRNDGQQENTFGNESEASEDFRRV